MEIVEDVIKDGEDIDCRMICKRKEKRRAMMFDALGAKMVVAPDALVRINDDVVIVV